MQRAQMELFAERSIFYTCRLVSKSLNRGDDYDIPHVLALFITEKPLPVFEDSMHQKLTNMEKEEYKKSVLEYEDVQKAVRYARKQGRAEGREQGREEGREEGLAQGREQGLAEGREAEKRLLVLNMLAEGLDPAVVAKIAKLTEEEVRAMAG